jgi:Sec-independent protein secretion pathway component TatC
MMHSRVSTRPTCRHAEAQRTSPYIKLLIGLGLIFQMPTIAFLSKIGVVTARFLVAQLSLRHPLIFIVAACDADSAIR